MFREGTRGGMDAVGPHFNICCGSHIIPDTVKVSTVII